MIRFAWLPLLLAAGLPAAAAAQDVQIKPLVDARLRYEHDDQDGLPQASDDVVARIRAGVEVDDGHWSAVGQAQGTLALVDRYFDGLHGMTTRPLVYDPQDLALYRAQLRYATPAVAVTAGRQRIELDDQRFVGAADWRINGQTFDAVRGEWQVLPAVRLDVSYVRAIRTIWGVDGAGARPGAIGGNSVLAQADVRSPIGTLVGFAYLIDEDAAAVSRFGLENQTYGARLFGKAALPAGATLAYKATYARQSDWHRNPNHYTATYLQVDGRATLRWLGLNAGYERLGADGGAPLTSFQFPFGTNFLYQGWTNKFLTTPADGLRDLYGGPSVTVKRLGPLGAVTFQAVGHRFTSDLLRRHDGDEVDLLAQAKLRRTTLTLRYADYRADTVETDTRKLWLQADLSY